jgi:hypothetical protein
LTRIKAGPLQMPLTGSKLKEQAMEQTQEGPALAAARHLLSRVREWWGHRSELDTMHPEDLARLARDLGVTGPELRDLAARGPDASHLLYERMHALGLTKADVERLAPGLMRDLERTCACCQEKGVCERDLVARPGSPTWGGYCPNAAALTSVVVAKDRSPSRP